MALTEDDVMKVLRSSLYPGAKDESIKMVIAYCQAAGLDVMQKPVHIVPMLVATGEKDKDGWDKKEMRDVIMPGIGSYRTQAARSGSYAGVTEPEFGSSVSRKLGDADITYPEWCKITVKRAMPSGSIVEFTAMEFWTENYATKSNKVDTPNAMWKKRPYAQLAKCAEAQALRKAFPEFGAAPTADEMEGKFEFETGNTIDGNTGDIIQQPISKSKPEVKTKAEAEPRAEVHPDYKDDGDKGIALASDGMKKVVRSKMEGAALSELDLKAKFVFGVDSMPAAEVNNVLAWIQDPTGE